MLGVAGGIGSGKSTIARAFQALGCVVIDSDTEARTALRLPDVKQTLVSWWGGDILDPSGDVDRAKVGAIVFANETERRRLEGLIHPLVTKSRRDAIAAGIARVGCVPRGVIYDAPLLFEAGLDRECDAVVFVDAPADLRYERVRRARGWSREEFDRREQAQWPLERKKSLCRFVVDNGSDQENPAAQCTRIVAILTDEFAPVAR